MCLSYSYYFKSYARQKGHLIRTMCRRSLAYCVPRDQCVAHNLPRGKQKGLNPKQTQPCQLIVPLEHLQVDLKEYNGLHLYLRAGSTDGIGHPRYDEDLQLYRTHPRC